MDWGILALLDNFLNQYGLEKLFILFAAIISVGFLLNTILSLTVCGYSFVRRTWFLFFCAAFTVLYSALTKAKGGGEILSLLLGVVSLVFCGPCFVLPVRVKKIKEEQRALARLIDGAIKGEEKKGYDFPLRTMSNINRRPPDAELPPVFNEKDLSDKAAEVGLDFSHVKNVIARLEYFDLNSTDKRQVGELENCIRIAERVGADEDIKMKINDGLGALLKLMSKYGV